MPATLINDEGDIVGTYDSLAAAVTDALDGYLIELDAESFLVASTIAITKSITIRGPNAGLSGQDDGRDDESAITGPSTGPVFQVTGAIDFVIEGVKITGDTVMNAGAPGQTITVNTSVLDITATQDNVFYVGNAGGYTFNFMNNKVDVTGYTEFFQLFEGGVVNVKSNSFTGRDGTYASGDDNDVPLIVNISDGEGDVLDNVFTHVDIGVLVANGSGPLNIVGNSFQDLHREAGATAGGKAAGIVFFTPAPFSDTITIDDNQFTDADAGIRTSGVLGSTTETSDIVIVNNDFDAVASPLFQPESVGGTLTATDSTVDDEPVAVISAGSGAGPVTLLDADGVFSGYYATIQEAVDAAEDDYTVVIAAGEYEEQVTIAGFAGLTLEAAGDGPVIVRAPETLAINGSADYYGSGFDVYAVIAVNDSTEVSISGITIDGDYATDSSDNAAARFPSEASGIAYLRSSGAIDDVTIAKVGASPTGPSWGDQSGSAIIIDGTALATPPAVAITGSTLNDFQKSAIFASGVVLTATGNTITGVGADPILAQVGIQLSGASGGEISGNTIDAIGYSGSAAPDDYAAAVVVFESTDVDMTGNIITGANDETPDAKVYGVALINTSGGEATGNTISFVDIGIEVSGTVTPTPTVVEPNSYTDIDGTDQFGQALIYAPDDNTEIALTVRGSALGDTLEGGAANDSIDGLGGDDTLRGEGGDDTLTGGGGIDTAEYAGSAEDYTITGSQDENGFFTSFTGVSDDNDADGDDGADTLSNVETLEFADGETVSLTGNVQLLNEEGGFVGSFGTIQAAIDAAETGYTVNVGAGDYAENLVITTSGVTLQGAPNRASTIRPGVSNATDGNVITVRADNVTISGFVIDGANEELSGGVTMPDGAVSHAARLISNYQDALAVDGLAIDGLRVQDNELLNGQRFGVVNFNTDGPSGGTVISGNFFHDIAGLTSTGALRVAVLTGQEAYTDVTNNVMEDVGTGIETRSMGAGDPVDAAVTQITGNTISAQRGIFINNHYSAAAPFNVSGNTVTLGENAVQANSNGIRIWSIFNGATITVGDNEISGMAFGYRLANNPGELVINGGTLSGNTVAVSLYDNYGFGNAAGANLVTLAGVTLADSTVAHIQVDDTASISNVLTVAFDADEPPVVGDAPSDVLLNGDTAAFDANGFDGDLVIRGDGSPNELEGGDGDDLLDGGAGADAMAGGSGDDDYIVDNAGDTVTENANQGVDEVFASISYTLTGAVENLTLTGTAVINGTGNGAANVITGNAAANTLNGEGGDDTLIGRAGGDTLNGGDGVDTADYSASATGVQLNLATGTTAGGDAQGDTLSGVENLIGSAFTDTLTGDGAANRLAGGAGGDTLNGGAGIDTMVGGSGDDAYVIDNSADAAIELANEGDDGVTAFVSYTLGANVERLTLTGTGNLNGTGNGGNNVLTGNSGNNTLTGGGGNDLLDGQAGADTMVGGTGDDSFVVGTGDTVVEQAGEGTDEIRTALTSYTLGANLENLTFVGTGSAKFTGTGNSAANTITGGAGADRLDGKAGADRLVGLGGDDSYTVDNAGDQVIEAAGGGTDSVSSGVSYTLGAQVENLTLTGSAAINGTGNDLANRITGNGAANTLTGGEGDDTLDGGNGADLLVGGTGSDTYVVGRPDDVTEENAGEGVDLVLSDTVTYTLYDNVENLTLRATRAITGIGNGLANVITGNSSANTLEGGAGNDTLDGKGGSDTMRGGADDDTYVVDASGDKVEENASAGTDTVRASIASYTLGANVENLVYTGSSSFAGTGNAAANQITGGAGNDTLDGKGGADTLRGLGGNDTYVVDNAGDTIEETAGVDTVITSLNSFTLAAGLENLTFNGTGAFTGTGNNAANTITGAGGNDRLDGGSGSDTLVGLGGDDTYLVDSASDVVTEAAGGGVDTVETAASSYTLSAHVENLTYTGAGAFTGTGNGSANTIRGGALADTLNGGAGLDTLFGFGGDDIYVVDDAGDVTVETGTGGTDTVRSTAAAYTLGDNVENIVLLSGGGSATGNGLNNALTGNSGNNTLDGGLGADTMTGGTGNDIYVIDDGGDVVVEGSNAGTDTVRTSLANYQLGSANLENLTYTGTGNFTGTGNSAENVITGGSGNDSIDGGAGTDRMIGLGGNDTYFVSRKEDVVIEEAGQGDSDQVLSSASSYTLAANVENLRLIDGGDDARGNALANLIVGNALANVLDGGAGADELRGGSGNDTFVFRKGEANGDKVADFTGAGGASGDRLQLSGYGSGASIAQDGGSDFYIITAGDGTQERIQLVGVYNLDTVGSTNDYFFGG